MTTRNEADREAHRPAVADDGELSRQPWTGPELERLATSSAEAGGAGGADGEGMS